MVAVTIRAPIDLWTDADMNFSSYFGKYYINFELLTSRGTFYIKLF